MKKELFYSFFIVVQTLNLKRKGFVETNTPMDSLRIELRTLIAKYGLPAVHTGLQTEMRETYDFLRQFYGPPKNNLVIPIAETIPDRIVTPHHKPIATMVVEIEPPELELSAAVEESHLTEAPQEKEVTRDPSLKEVVIQAKREMVAAAETGEVFSKVKHREEIAKKNKELLEKGIKPESLLTKENLTKWLGEGMSYMRIAREQVGLPETQISAMAKQFGLQSDIKKYIVMKKGGKPT